MSLAIRADTLTPIPPPYNWPPASKWDGVDGRWSTFAINVGDSGEGNDGQNFRVLISTHASGTYLPSGDVCGDREDPGACNQARGIEVYLGVQRDGFVPGTSKAWENLGTYSFSASLDSAVNYGYDGNEGPQGLWGTDNIGLGMASGTSPMLSNQPVALLEPRDNASYFMGMFGLSNLGIQVGPVTANTFLDVFRRENLIPSLAYGYTAGAHYGNDGRGVHTSLVLGGYDASRFNGGKSTQIQMPGQGGEDPYLIVGVQSIGIYSDGQQVNSATNGSNTFQALIDSTTPYLWLPDEICDRLEDIYGLEYNSETGLYTANDDNDNESLGLELKIGRSETSAEFVNILLPYAALRLDATWPLVENDTTYFPLKKSPTGEFVLGRAFLQEAYLIVDYERRNFTVAQAVITDPLPEPSIVPIISEQILSQSTPSSTPGGGGGSGGLGAGAIAGIVIGAVTALVIILAVLFFRRRSQKKKNKAEEPPLVEKDGNAFVSQNVYGDRPKPDRRASELEDPNTEYKIDHSRTSSAHGYYHRRSHSSSNRTELMGSPPPGSEKDRNSYFKFNPVSEPAPLAELSAGDGIAELDAARPKPNRRRSGGSGSNLQSPRSERPDPIAEEHTDPATEPVVGDVIASPMTEEYKDAREEITTETTSVEDKTATEATESTHSERKSVEDPKPTEQTSLLDNRDETSKPATSS